MRIVAMVFAPLVLIGLSACDESGELDHVNGPEGPGFSDGDTAIVGGWADAPIDDGAVIAATEFAARTGAGVELSEIIAAQTQVVAGMNYNLTMELVDGSLWQAEVYQPLEGDLVLTSFVPG